jgi:hypothetical protein
MSASENWGSPPWVADGARFIFGGKIDLDPASDPLWNSHVVKADRIITAQEDALDEKTWWTDCRGEPCDSVFLNPPGDRSGDLVQAFWQRLVDEWTSCVVSAGFYVGFSLEQLGTLQSATLSPLSPQLKLCVPRSRVRYLRPIKNPLIGLPYEECDAPTHGSFFCLLPARGAEGEAQLLRWREWTATVGATTNT